MIKFLACLLFVFIFLAFATPSWSQSEHNLPTISEGQVNEALFKTVPVRFLPGNPMYLLIRLKENTTRFFQPSSFRKGEFDIVLSGKRLKEVYLLLKRDDLQNASKTLKSYDRRLNKLSKELEKAKSQNQDVAILSEEIAESLRVHEVLLFAIEKNSNGKDDEFRFTENFDGAINAFKRVIYAIDIIKPGYKSRFKSVNYQEDSNKVIESLKETPVPEATFTNKPNKIIY